MAQIISPSSSGFYIFCNYTEISQNAATNKTKVRGDLYLHIPGSINASASKSGALRIGDSVFSFSVVLGSRSAAQDILLYSNEVEIEHANSDGTGGICKYGAWFTVGIKYSGVNVGTLSYADGSFGLTNIPRASEISFPNNVWNLGESTILSAPKNNSSYTNKLFVEGPGSDQWVLLTNDMGNSIDIGQNSTFQQKMYEWTTDSTTYSRRLGVDTYSGGTYIGTSLVWFRIYVPSSENKPTIGSVTYKQTASVVLSIFNEDDQKILQGFSAVNVIFSNVSAKNQSRILKYYVEYNGTTYNSDTATVSINTGGIPVNSPLSCYVVDSRGFESERMSINFGNNFNEYFIPTIDPNPSVYRSSSDEMKANVDFTVKFCKFAWELQSKEKIVKLYYKMSEETAFTNYVSMSMDNFTYDSTKKLYYKKYSEALNVNFNPNYNYNIKIVVIDNVATSQQNPVIDVAILQSTKPEMSIRRDAIGINCIPKTPEWSISPTDPYAINNKSIDYNLSMSSNYYVPEYVSKSYFDEIIKNPTGLADYRNGRNEAFKVRSSSVQEVYYYSYYDWDTKEWVEELSALPSGYTNISQRHNINNRVNLPRVYMYDGDDYEAFESWKANQFTTNIINAGIKTKENEYYYVRKQSCYGGLSHVYYYYYWYDNGSSEWKYADVTNNQNNAPAFILQTNISQEFNTEYHPGRTDVVTAEDFNDYIKVLPRLRPKENQYYIIRENGVSNKLYVTYKNPGSLQVDGFRLVDFFYKKGDLKITTNNVNPEKYLGGKWELYAQGKTIIGVDPNDTDFNNVGKTGGSKTVTLSAAIGPINNSPATLGYTLDSGPSEYQNNHTPAYSLSGTAQSFDHWNHSTVVTEFGKNDRNTSIMQPYITCYIWRRADGPEPE